uniref:Arb2 domain-containing protein n=1 Tax=Saccoglossus kowalevskii TaxID=10224 RepID=A0ABM0LV75_SACKO|nr:PREDICTED: putative protein FAM172B-like [Saccoglossus kowalevskii]
MCPSQTVLGCLLILFVYQSCSMSDEQNESQMSASPHPGSSQDAMETDAVEIGEEVKAESSEEEQSEQDNTMTEDEKRKRADRQKMVKRLEQEKEDKEREKKTHAYKSESSSSEEDEETIRKKGEEAMRRYQQYLENTTKKPDLRVFEFPKTMEEFKYAFNEDGELRHTETGERFEFNEFKNDHRQNQKRYEALGELITEYVYELLEKENLKKVTIPLEPSDEEITSFFYMSEDAMSNPDKLMVIIHGTGVVRAGQWSRKLIINNNLDSGTQIPYIRKAVKVNNYCYFYQTLQRGIKRTLKHEETSWKSIDLVFTYLAERIKKETPKGIKEGGGDQMEEDVKKVEKSKEEL